MPYYHIHVVIKRGANEHYEYDQTKESVEKLFDLYNSRQRFPVCGVLVDPDDVDKIRVYKTDLLNNEIMGARVWDIGTEVTRDFFRVIHRTRIVRRDKDLEQQVKILFLVQILRTRSDSDLIKKLQR